MKILSRINKFTRKAILTAVIVTAAVVSVAAYNNAHASDIVINTVRDCDSNAVMFCGAGSLNQLQNKYANGDNSNTISSIHHIYSSFGISATDINNMSQNAVAGEVFKDGTVTVNGVVVATNAWTAGREFISGSTQVTFDGTTFFKRHPEVSFVSSPLEAYVVMKNGVFQFAILASCGNPVVATPKLPHYALNKEVRTDSGNWQKSVKVKQGTQVHFRITVESTGEVAARNIKVKDQLPTNISFVNGTLQRNGNTIWAGDFFGSAGNVIDSLKPGDTITYTFEAIVGKNDSPFICRQMNNIGMITSPGLLDKNSEASVQETCIPKPTPTPTPRPTATPTPTCTPTPTPKW